MSDGPLSSETSTPEIIHQTNGAETVRVNGYKTREKRTIAVNGESRKWHLVKGTSEGTVITNADPSARINYSIYFDPDSKRWLKLVPTTAKGAERDVLISNLRAGVTIAKKSLELAGFPELAEQTEIVEDIQMPNGETTIGFTSPHIGPSIEQLTLEQTGQRIPTPETMEANPQLRDRIGSYYGGAMDLALKLYLDYGYWTGDVNPGNILLARDSQGEDRVVLIDFSSGTPLRDHLLMRKIPREVESASARKRHREKLRASLHANIGDLHLSFQQQCRKLGVPFAYDVSEGNQGLQAYIESIIDRELPALPGETNPQNVSDTTEEL